MRKNESRESIGWNCKLWYRGLPWRTKLYLQAFFQYNICCGATACSKKYAMVPLPAVRSMLWVPLPAVRGAHCGATACSERSMLWRHCLQWEEHVVAPLMEWGARCDTTACSERSTLWRHYLQWEEHAWSRPVSVVRTCCSTSIAMSRNMSRNSVMLFSSFMMSLWRASMSFSDCLACCVSIIIYNTVRLSVTRSHYKFTPNQRFRLERWDAESYPLCEYSRVTGLQHVLQLIVRRTASSYKQTRDSEYQRPIIEDASVHSVLSASERYLKPHSHFRLCHRFSYRSKWVHCRLHIAFEDRKYRCSLKTGNFDERCEPGLRQHSNRIRNAATDSVRTLLVTSLNAPGSFFLTWSKCFIWRVCVVKQ